MLRLGQVDAAEVAAGEYDTLGAEASQVVVTEVMTLELPLGPDCGVVAHSVSRAAARG